MTQLTNELFCIEVPEGAHNFKTVLKRSQILVYTFNGTPIQRPLHIFFAVQIIGLSHELSEGQCKGLVGSIPYGNLNRYKSYDNVSTFYLKAKESLQSLLESKGLTPSTKNYLILKRIEK